MARSLALFGAGELQQKPLPLGRRRRGGNARPQGAPDAPAGQAAKLDDNRRRAAADRQGNPLLAAR
jgi:hypothetical protein